MSEDGVKWGIEALKEATGGSASGGDEKPEKKEQARAAGPGEKPSGKPLELKDDGPRPAKPKPAAKGAPPAAEKKPVPPDEEVIIACDWTENSEEKGGIDRLSDKISRMVPWGKSRLLAGILVKSDQITAVLVSGSGDNFSVKDASTVKIEGSTYAAGLKNAVRSLSRKWKLGRADNYAALDSHQVSYNFISLPGLSCEQMQQTVCKHLRAEGKWDPSSDYLAFSPVGAAGSRTRVFSCYTSRELVLSVLDAFSAEGAKVHAVEPDVVSLHRYLSYGGMLEDRTLALVDVAEGEGRISLFTESGVALSRSLLGGGAGSGDEIEGVEGGPRTAGGGLDPNIAVDEIVRTCNYYEYSLSAGKVDALALTGESDILESLSAKLDKDIGIPVEEIASDIPMLEEAACSFEHCIHDAGLGAVLSGVTWK